MDGQDEETPFPRRLYHDVPSWVNSGSYFHIRIRTAPVTPRALIDPEIAGPLLDSVRHYHIRSRWHCLIFLLMPDHAHALLAFPAESPMSQIIGDWKRYAKTTLGVNWQVNYFDHRIRDDRGLAEKYAYIRRNPVVKGLCAEEVDWPWVWQPADPLG